MCLLVTKSCERNSYYSFSWIFLKPCRCLCQGMKMCMTFDCNPQINICHFFGSSNLVIFGLKAFRHLELNSSYSFTWIFLKLCRCLCQGMKMCMTFGYISQMPCTSSYLDINRLIFVTFYQFELRYFWVNANRHWVSCEPNSYNFTWIFLKLCRCLCQGMKSA